VADNVVVLELLVGAGVVLLEVVGEGVVVGVTVVVDVGATVVEVVVSKALEVLEVVCTSVQAHEHEAVDDGIGMVVGAAAVAVPLKCAHVSVKLDAFVVELLPPGKELVDEAGVGVVVLGSDAAELGAALVVVSAAVVQSHAHAVFDVAVGAMLEVVGAAVLLPDVVWAAVLLVDGAGVVLLVQADFAIAVHEQAHVHIEQPAKMVLLDVVGAGGKLLDVVAAPVVVVALLVAIEAVVILLLDVGAGVDEVLGSTEEVPSPKGEVDVLLSHTHWSCNTEPVAAEVVLLLCGVVVICAIHCRASESGRKNLMQACRDEIVATNEW